MILGKVELTWDETDPKRIAAMHRAFENDDNDDDVNAYLAMSDNEDNQDLGDVEDEFEDDEDVIAKYKALFADISAKEKKKEEEKGNMEVVFGGAEGTLKKDLK